MESAYSVLDMFPCECQSTNNIYKALYRPETSVLLISVLSPNSHFCDQFLSSFFALIGSKVSDQL